jgi:hypothetical protein
MDLEIVHMTEDDVRAELAERGHCYDTIARAGLAFMETIMENEQEFTYSPSVLAERITSVIADARRLPRSREASIVITHLETAELWMSKIGSTEPTAGPDRERLARAR